MEIAEDKLLKQLKAVIDPEIGVSIMDLGLIYGAKEKNGIVTVKMTLTSPHCPMFSMMESDIIENLMKIKGVKKVKVDLVFKPMWSPEKMSPKLRKKLGI
jgi:metal-sulfur cluster biosynthetic enzyme